MATKLQIRNDTTENWLAVNPILAIGEIGYETTTNRAKFGDGVSKWSDLPYLKCEVYNDLLLKEKIEEINQNLDTKANLEEVYTKQQIEDMLFVTADELYAKNYMEKNEALDKFLTRQEVWEQNYGYVPTERTINGKELSEDIVLDYTDVKALSETTKVSELENDAEYITKTEVDEMISQIGGGNTDFPDQTDNAGKFLSTDGENLSWEKAVKNSATISSDDALAIGLSSRVTTNRTIAVGHYSQAHSGGAVAFGGSAYASASNSVAIGTNAITYGDNSIALGHNSKTDHNPDENYTSENSVAIGYSAISKGNSQIIIGDTASGSGDNSIAVGKGATAKGENAVVIGSNALSNSPQGANVVIGPDSKVNGYSFNSTAIGIGTQATNYDATAIGRSSIAGTQYSTAIGHNAITNSDCVDDSDTTDFPSTLALGMSAHSRSNSTIAIGKHVYADGPYSTVIGYKSKVEEGCDKGISIGSEAQVIGSEGIAVGNTAKSARHGIALGTRAKVNEFGGVAIGLNTDSDGTNAITIGNQSYARGGNSVAIGSSAIVDYGADSAVQLGTGTNSDAYTLQFRDYKLLYENGTIPYERLSEYTPSNGQVLTYDDNQDALVWSEASGGISEVNWGDITGNINNQTDLKNKFDNINNNIQSLDLDMSTNYQNLNRKFDNAIQNLEQDFSTTTRRLEIDIQDTEDKLQSQIDTLSAIGEFLAIWDCDTGSARYLTEGYEYRTGNYFIIGTIAEGEGVVNYMPDGNMYPGKAETSEDVRVSDMWFYDGEHWIYLANHERAVAIDADLDANSTNPIENKAVAEAVSDLDVKIDNKTDALSNAIEELQNRPIPIAVPQLASVDVEQIKDQIMKEERRPKEEWMGNYSDIIVTTNLDKETLINNMYDLYVTISRFKTNKNLSYMSYNENGDEFEIKYRNVPKYSVMNDLRQKTDMRLYCWRFVTNSSYNETDPRRYCYFYTKNNYNDDVDTLWEEDPSIGLWSNYSSSSGIGTCFNAIVWNEHGYYVQMFYDDYFENGSIERYEEGDIDSFANVSNSANYPEYNISDYVTKMECRKYTKDGKNYFFWAKKDEWENGGYGYCYGDYLNPIPNGIPEHMDMLSNAFDEVQQIEENGFVFVEKRPDLNYKQVKDFEALLEALQELTFCGKFVDYEGRPTYWNCYWFDYPVMPIMLKDCEVRKHESDGANRWIKLEDLVKEGDTDKLRDDLPLELKLPYNTYYLWMRFCSLQKRCAYGDYSNWLDEEGRGIDIPMYPHQKHNLLSGVQEYNVLGKRAFARPRQAYKNNGFGKVSEYIQFNICYPNTVYSGVKSKSTPITKKLNITSNATSGLRD